MNNGDIIRVETKIPHITSVYDFPPNVLNPTYYGGLMQASDGKIYGMTTYGGRYGLGTIFSYNPANRLFKKVHDFDGKNGARPIGILIQAKNGLLYGVTSGYDQDGIIFSFDPITESYENLFSSISLPTSIHPESGLLEAGNGKLYGTSMYSPGLNFGSVYCFDPVAKKLEILHEATSSGDPGGSFFYGKIEEGSNGKLYGIASQGGVFSIEPRTNFYSLIYPQPFSIHPEYAFTRGADGNLYGAGGGVLFSFDPVKNQYTKLADSSMELMFIEKSMQRMVGVNSLEIILSYDLQSKTFTRHFDLKTAVGKVPTRGLLEGNDGKWYGMTEVGGFNNMGTLYSFDPSTGQYEMIEDFKPINGAAPVESLVYGSDNMLYGVTDIGGVNGTGVIFTYDEEKNMYRKLYDFQKADGANPAGKLMPVQNGDFFGMTRSGGQYGWGVIYSFNPSTGSYLKLHDFDSSNGSSPKGSLRLAKNGKLYGMTYGGGKLNMGVLFSFDAAINEYNVLYEFDSQNGMKPEGSLIEGSDGKLYGMTPFGGVSGGVIFSYDPISNIFKKEFDFVTRDGDLPYGNLCEGRDKKLYGLTSREGQNGTGVLFSFDPLTKIYSKLFQFRYPDLLQPFGSLVQGSDGKLYGASKFGTFYSNTGFVFSFDPDSNKYRKLVDFIIASGPTHWKGELIESRLCQAFTVSCSNNGPLCSGSALRLNATGGFTYQWSGPGGFTSTEQNPVIPNADTTASGTYYVTARSEKGCEVKDSTLVLVYPKPKVSAVAASGITRFCEGGEVSLSVITAGKIQWYKNAELIPGADSDTLIAKVTGLYSVLVSDSNGCSVSSDTVEVIVDENPAKPVISRDGSTLSTSPGFSIYNWYLNGNPLPATGAVYNPVQPGKYTVRVEDQNGCSATSDPYEISIINPPRIVLGNASLYCYPNPVSDVLRIYNSGTTSPKIHLQIADMTGKIVWEQDLTSSLHNISTGHLKPGLYNLVFSDGKEKRSAKILVVRQ